ncbi:phospholipase B-like 1 [Styela clava]
MKFLLLLFFSLLVLQVFCDVQEGSIVFNDGKFLYKEGILDDALAYGSFNDSIDQTGWSVLDITAVTHSKKYKPEEIMFAAGMLEGAFTSKRIHQHYDNLKGFLFDNRPADTYNRTCDFFTKQEKWVKEKVAAKDDVFWNFIGYIQSQIEGLLWGYKVTSTDDLNMCDMQILSAVGDMIDLLHVLNRPPDRYFENLSKERLRRFAQQNGHCSALIKVTAGYENLFMGHSSWFVYSAMLRIYKNYDFQVYGKDIKNTKMSFSSYPGFLNSLDDFYILGNGMVMLQTTNNIYNTSLYDLVFPESLLAWQRVRAANFLATNGKEWGEILKMYNSGTYNNQYMIIDLSKFTVNVGFDDGALYVVEQIPGLVESYDQTNILREGYWASYNVPFYETIYNKSGYPAVAKDNPDNSHDLAPRAKIFRRDQNEVVDMESMKKILRFNNYKLDNYSEGDACNSICCRGDLQTYPINSGCYDTKVTDYFFAKNFTSYAISGPTRGGESQIPAYRWTSGMPHHEGMPDLYRFPFVMMKPKYF